MKTLVIHPFDLSTSFLSEIYEDTNWTIIDINPNLKYLKEQIKIHDRIVMLGHGTENGLIGFNKFIINSSLIYLLKNKLCVCIWCNADKFVEKYKLKGIYTGMIISEINEAYDYSINVNINQIVESNNLFASSIKNAIDNSNFLTEVKLNYKSDNNPVIIFNEKNIYTT
jgi:hypothetical protein